MQSLRCLLILSLILLGTHSAVSASTPAHLWSQRFGDAGSEWCYSSAVDASGNIVVVGSFSGTIAFPGFALVSSGSNDIFIIKFNAAGAALWGLRFGDVANQSARGVDVDPAGNIVVVGEFFGTVNFGGGNLVSAGQEDIFLAKFSSAGTHQWSKRFGDATIQRPGGVAVDASSNVVITGYFLGTVNFGGVNLSNAGPYDIFVAKFNSAGVHQWSSRFGDNTTQHGIAVATNGAGEVLVTGDMEGTVNFGGGNLVSAGGYDIFLVKFNAAGAHQWSQRFGDLETTQQGNTVAVDGSNNIILGGHFDGAANFGGGILTATPVDVDVFVAKFNSAGTHQWSQRYGDASGQYMYSLAVDGSGNIAFTGQYSGTINFGGSDLVSVGTGNVYLASLTGAGAHRWSSRYGGAVYPYTLSFDPLDDVVLTGSFSTTVDFGGGLFTALGINDAFLVKFGSESAEPEILDIVDVPNDQGRHVKIRFNASGADNALASEPIIQYEAFRRSDPAPALTAGDAAVTTGWMFVASVPAHAETDYEMEAPTLGDSTVALGPYNSTFFVRAATAAPPAYFDSEPDSGYSLDNLAPGVPENLIYTAGELSWDESDVADFDYFTVYGSNTESFGAATAIDYSVGPDMDVTASPYVFYFVTATDFAGNESKPAKVNTLSGAGGTPTNYALSISSYPNPFNPETTIRYTVPAKGRVTVAVYDARGTHVATLVDEEKPAGAFTQAWNGQNSAGKAVSSGVYFTRIAHPAGARSYKIVLLK